MFCKSDGSWNVVVWNNSRTEGFPSRLLTRWWKKWVCVFCACSDWSVKVDLYVVKEKEGKVMAEVGGRGGQGSFWVEYVHEN